MKKTILAAALISTTLLAGTLAVHAVVLNWKSNEKIGLTAQDQDLPVGPIDPIDPDDNPPSNDPTGNTGDLRIDYMSKIDFGKQTISGKTETYTAEKPALTTEVQVSDLRGTGAGWNLQVSYDTEKPGFTSEDKTLNGAELTLPVGTPETAEDNSSAAPATSKVVVNNDAQNIMSAAANTGLGTWADEMEPGNVTLKVPSGNLVGDYTATLVWTLSDAPA